MKGGIEMKIIIETLQDETYDVWKKEVEIEDTPKQARNKAECFTEYFNRIGFDVRVTETDQKISKK